MLTTASFTLENAVVAAAFTLFGWKLRYFHRVEGRFLQHLSHLMAAGYNSYASWETPILLKMEGCFSVHIAQAAVELTPARFLSPVRFQSPANSHELVEISMHDK